MLHVRMRLEVVTFDVCDVASVILKYTFNKPFTIQVHACMSLFLHDYYNRFGNNVIIQHYQSNDIHLINVPRVKLTCQHLYVHYNPNIGHDLIKYYRF